jgi:hypothetical protein
MRTILLTLLFFISQLSLFASNPDVDGGMIVTTDGATQLDICAGDGISDEFDVVLTGNVGTFSAWVITDADGNILGLPAAPPFDLEGAGEGVCLVWHLSHEDDLTGAEVGANADDLGGCFDLSNPITVTRTGVNGGALETTDGATELDICAGDGVSDAFDVVLTDNEGTNSAWVITDDAGNILALPPAPPFDLEGAGGGICLVWHLSFEDGLTGAEVGMNAADLEGCFDLSNPITVTRTGVNGGALETTDGATQLDICAGDGVSDAFDVVLTDNEGTNSAWVITDADGNILGLPAAPPFDLEGAGEGVCLVWHLSFEDGLMGAEVGLNANDLIGCFSLSNPVTVTRTGVNGGALETTDGATELDICAGDGVSDAFDVVLTDNEGTNSAWVITDDAGNILALPPAPPFDLEGAGGGICLVWHLSFEDGLTGAEVGMNAADLEGCFDLSNPITVNRTGVNGGALETTDGATQLDICAGDGVSDAFDVVLTDNEGTNSAWVITDADGNILGLPAAPPFDLEGAGEGVCLVWHLSFEDGLMGAEVGLNANDLIGCFSLSNPITVTRTGVNGGALETTDGATELDICAGDGISDAFDVVLTDNEGTNSAWVITDDAGNILALPPAPPFDLEGAGGGICLVWHLSFEDGLTGAEVGLNAADLEGCFDLSNPITVNRTGVDGGSIATPDGQVEFEICVGDGESDAFDVVLTDDEGTNSAWVITDADGNILALPAAPPFDLEGAGAGTCLVWHLSFEDGLTGADVGENAADLEGCFDLSNPITVIRNPQPEGGMLELAGGGTELDICAGDGVSDAFDVALTGNTGPNEAWVITDILGNILGLPAGPPFDLEGAGSGVCLVWHLSFEDGLVGAEVGLNANDLEGCYDLSNPITVNRTGVDGGEIETTDGQIVLEICAGDGESDAFDVNLTGTDGSNSAWVITDLDGNILGLPAAPPFDLEGAGAGTCLIWHLSFEDGLVGAEVGLNANDLEGCFDLSNAITVIRNEEPMGGTLSLVGGGTEIDICAGDGVSDAFDVELMGNTGSNSAWVITDADGNILGLPAAPPFDLEGAGEGVCLIWNLGFEDGLMGAEIGMNANDLEGCFGLSNPITVTRTGVNGGILTTTDGTTELDICAGDGVSDAFDVTLTDNEGTNSGWVITDTDGNILGLPAAPPFDLEGAGEGVCLVWHISFEDGLMGAEVGMNAADLEGCFSLSNPITVTRTGVNGGDLVTADGASELDICAGDGISDAFDVFLAGNEGTNSAWVITDADGNILELPAGPPFDLEGAGEGVCLVWHLSFEDGLMGAEVGMNANDLEGCFSLSNPITVNRTGVEGGMVTTVDGEETLEICVGDGEADEYSFQTTSTLGEYAYVVTDEDNIIVGLPPANTVDFEGAGFGTCRVWGLSYSGNVTAELGQDAAAVSLSDDCFVLSETFVTVIRDTTGANCITATFEVNPADFNLSMKPNPVSQMLFVEWSSDQFEGDELNVQLYNANGVQMTQFVERPLGLNHRFEINVQNYPAGVYLLQVRDGNRIRTERFIKQ